MKLTEDEVDKIIDSMSCTLTVEGKTYVWITPSDAKHIVHMILHKVGKAPRTYNAWIEEMKYTTDYNGELPDKTWEENGYKRLDIELPTFGNNVLFLSKPIDAYAGHRTHCYGHLTYGKCVSSNGSLSPLTDFTH